MKDTKDFGLEYVLVITIPLVVIALIVLLIRQSLRGNPTEFFFAGGGGEERGYERENGHCERLRGELRATIEKDIKSGPINGGVEEYRLRLISLAKYYARQKIEFIHRDHHHPEKYREITRIEAIIDLDTRGNTRIENLIAYTTDRCKQYFNEMISQEQKAREADERQNLREVRRGLGVFHEPRGTINEADLGRGEIEYNTPF